MNGGSDDLNSLEHTHIPEAVCSQEGFSNYPCLPLMGSSIEDYLRLSNISPAYLHSNNHASEKAEMGVDFQTQLGFDIDSQQEYNSHVMQEPLHNPHIPLRQLNWAESIDGIQGMNIHNHQQQQFNLQCFTSTSSYSEATPELLNLLQFPGCSAVEAMLPANNIYSELPVAQSISTPTDIVLYNQLNFPSQGPVFRELFHGLPHNFNIPGSRAGSSFDGMDVRDADEGLYQEEDGRHFENSGLDFKRGKGKCKGQVKGAQHYNVERNRREKFNEKYEALKSLLPNSPKSDRASLVSGTIDYIKELRRTADELTMLVKRKRFQKERSKRLKVEDEMPDKENSFMKSLADGEQPLNATMRSSWLLRKSKETIVDVRIVEDEANIKLTQRRKVNCLLLVGEVLDELQMELLHVSGGNIGDYNIFMFNTKVTEGSSVYAGGIAQKLIEVLDKTNPN